MRYDNIMFRCTYTQHFLSVMVALIKIGSLRFFKIICSACYIFIR